MTHSIFPTKQLSCFTGLMCNNLFFPLLLPKSTPLVVLLNVSLFNDFFKCSSHSVTQKFIGVWKVATGNAILCSFLIWASGKSLLKEIQSLQRIGFSAFSLTLGQALMPQLSLLSCGPALAVLPSPDRHYDPSAENPEVALRFKDKVNAP